MKSDFSLARKRLGIYFNPGDFRYSVQQGPENAGQDDPRLRKAILAALAAFNRVYDKEQDV